MNKLLKDAIADAKAVRETALANAKVALEEAFAPKLQSMLSHKIKEEMEEEDEAKMEGEMTSDEDQTEVARMQKMAGLSEEDDEDMEMEPEADDEDMGDDEVSMDDEAPMEEPAAEEEPSMDDEEMSDEDLEEILRELEMDGDQNDSEEETMDEESVDRNAANYDVDATNESEDPEAKEMDEEIDLDEIIKALKEEDETEEEAPAKEDDKSEELEEAYSVIKFLRSKLNEVNLLNAKLLFVNKLFRKGELTESQKVKVIETFDRAKNVREAKLIYATLSESMTAGKTTKVAPKKKMTEGFASAPQAKTKIISESNGVYDRFKSLVEYNNSK